MSTGIYDKYTGYHHRRSIRLPGYDYSKPGVYFITICTHDRTNHLFGDIINGKMAENGFGNIVRNEWFKTPQMRPNSHMDAFIIMPNHVHGIIVIGDRRGDGRGNDRGDYGRGTLQRAPAITVKCEQFGKPTPNSIPTIVRLIKSATTKQINELRNTPGMPVWQRNYYERIVRDPKSLYGIRRTIRDNPRNWLSDVENRPKNELCNLDEA
jgi:putative transposase